MQSVFTRSTMISNPPPQCCIKQVAGESSNQVVSSQVAAHVAIKGWCRQQIVKHKMLTDTSILRYGDVGHRPRRRFGEWIWSRCSTTLTEMDTDRRNTSASRIEAGPSNERGAHQLVVWLGMDFGLWTLRPSASGKRRVVFNTCVAVPPL